MVILDMNVNFFTRQDRMGAYNIWVSPDKNRLVLLKNLIVFTWKLGSCSQIWSITNVAQDPTISIVHLTFSPKLLLYLWWWSIISVKHLDSRDLSKILLWSTSIIFNRVFPLSCCSDNSLKFTSSTQGTSKSESFKRCIQNTASVRRAKSTY